MISHYRTPVNILLTMLSVTGILVIFIPFTHNVTPLMAVFNLNFTTFGFAIITSPMLLPVFISAMSIHLLSVSKLSKFETYLAYGVLVSIVLATVITLVLLFSSKAVFFLICIIIGNALIVYLIIKTRCKKEINKILPIMVMQFLYITYAVYFLVEFISGFTGGWQIGAYFTLFTVIIYSAYIFYNLKMNPVSAMIIKNRQSENL